MAKLNACLNALSAVLLVLGYLAIRRGERKTHERYMLSALASSTVFLISYLVYHWRVGSVPFQGQGMIRTVYFTILITHTTLAVTVPVLAGITLFRALKQYFPRHKAIARWTLPIWLYVSVTGVIVYFMLYQLGSGN